MRTLGLQAYRMSTSWPRVLPAGVGRVNVSGLDFYDRLVDALLEAGIEPYVTLFHWDFPQALYLRQGWLNRESPDWFAQYTQVIVERLSDRVSHWMTINEPQVLLDHGHMRGTHAPGDRLALQQTLEAGHNLLRAHGMAVQAIRAHARGDVRVGYAPVGVVKMPETEISQDVEAAAAATFSSTDHAIFNNTWWLDPLLLGTYPEDGLRFHGDSVPKISDGDMDVIQQPLDFLGLNIYFGHTARAGSDGRPDPVNNPASTPYVSSNLPVTPEALYWGPRFLFERYGVPIIITENGTPGREWISLDGKVHDPHRIDFLWRYLLQLHRAVEEGSDIRGYFQWSILDNFEWSAGYRERFGLIFVDHATQRRVLKDSAHWYRHVIETNGDCLHDRPGNMKVE
jgi:beta-glucosidase